MKKILLTALQVAVTIGLLWWVFHDPERRGEMLAALKLADWWWLVVGVVVFFGCTVVATARWKILLAVQDIHMTWLRTWQLFMVGRSQRRNSNAPATNGSGWRGNHGRTSMPRDARASDKNA